LPPKISVQICSYNRKNLLEKSLRCLFDQTLPREDFEVIVVDDGSNDGTADMVESLSPPFDLIFIRQPKLGLAAGRNKGIRRARGRFILFIDDDVLADPRLLEEHLRFHETHPKAIVKGWVNHVPFLERPTKPRWNLRDFSTALFWTSNVSVEKRYLEEAGLFDEDFKEYGWEDLELGLRLSRLGLKTYTHKKAIGFHYKREISGVDLPAMLRQAEAKGRTAFLFVQKQPCWRARLSTGFYPLRMSLDSIFSHPRLLSFYKRFVPSNGKLLSAWSRFCMQALVNARYFQTLREASRSSLRKSL
jgi:glycosyltransferase involved in cell wall biosynthesis